MYYWCRQYNHIYQHVMNTYNWFSGRTFDLCSSFSLLLDPSVRVSTVEWRLKDTREASPQTHVSWRCRGSGICWWARFRNVPWPAGEEARNHHTDKSTSESLMKTFRKRALPRLGIGYDPVRSLFRNLYSTRATRTLLCNSLSFVFMLSFLKEFKTLGALENARR